MTEFEHGGDVKSFAKMLNCKQKNIIDLSSNINFVKPKINFDFSKVNFSSYPNYKLIKKQIASFYNTKNKNIELFNGGSSAIFSLFQNIENSVCAIYAPAYLEYKKAAKIHQKELVLINRLAKKVDTAPNNSMIVFVNPSTPDGKFYNLHNILKELKEKNCIVIIDESFLEFTDKKSCVKFIKQYDNLYILKSMTKIFASAGIRLGVVISQKQNIQKLQITQPLWKISSFDINYIRQAINNNKFLKKSLKKNKNAKKYLKKILKKSKLFDKIYKSNANFILTRLKNITADSLQKKLIKSKILIRNCANFDYLDSRFVRFAVKNKKSLKKLKNRLIG